MAHPLTTPSWLASRQNLKRKAAKGPSVRRHISCREMQLTAEVFSMSALTAMMSRAPQLLITETKKAQNIPSAMPPVLNPNGMESRPSPQKVFRIEKYALYADAVRCFW